MVEYQRKTSSGVAKAGLATAAATAGLILLNGGGTQLFRGAAGPGTATFAADPTGGYVTDKEMCLIRELSGKDAIIAQQAAEKYADAVVKSEVEPLKTRVCELEKDAAVNAARDQDFRRYVNSEFVHQPKATIRESIVVCKQCGCECERGCECRCGH